MCSAFPASRQVLFAGGDPTAGLQDVLRLVVPYGTQTDAAAPRHFPGAPLPTGLQVWLPVDLLSCNEPRVAPALLRAFGRYLVAADDAAAAALASRFGLSSVTLAGSVSHR
jgi:hypothetical protein